MINELLNNFVPFNEQEKNDLNILNTILGNLFFPLFSRENPIYHFTSSSWIVNEDFTKVLMVYHNIYDSWSWTGGHCDGDTNLLRVAVKEALEETGLSGINILSSKLFSLEILPVNSHIKNGKFISSHLHINFTFLLKADENMKLKAKFDENSSVKWIPIDSISDYVSEKNMLPIYEKLNLKLKESI